MEKKHEKDASGRTRIGTFLPFIFSLITLIFSLTGVYFPLFWLLQNLHTGPKTLENTHFIVSNLFQFIYGERFESSHPDQFPY